MKLSNEVKALILCCRLESEKKAKKELDSIIEQNNFNWDYFLKLTNFHRQIPLVYQSLIKTNSRDKLTDFRKIFDIINKENFEKYLECLHLNKVFKENSIDCLNIKGTWLSKYLHGNSFLRQSKDLDILIEENNLKKAHQILIKEGYHIIKSQNHPLTEKQEAIYHKRSKDISYYHSQKKVMVEIHYKLIASSELFPLQFKKTWRKRHVEVVNDITLAGLNNEELWAYQCYHGSRAGWFRLHWLTDIYYLYNKKQWNWEKLYHNLAQYNSQIPFLEALLLLKKLYNLEIPKVLEPKIRRNKSVADLAKISINTIQTRKKITTIHRLNRMPKIHGYIKYYKNILYDLCPTKENIARYSLPDKLFYIYYLTKPLFYLQKRYTKTNE